MFYPDIKKFKEISQNNDVNTIPVIKEIVNDEVTPTSVFKQLEQENEYAYLLESVENGENLGRYTFVGVNPLALIKYNVVDKQILIQENGEILKQETTDDPFSHVKEYMAKFRPFVLDDLPPFVGGAVGYVGYDMIRTVEDLPDIPNDDLNLPDMYFMVSDTVIVFDHLQHKILVCSNVLIEDDVDKSYGLAVQKIEKLMNSIGTMSLDFVKDKIESEEKTDINSITSNFEKAKFEQAVEKCKEYVKAGDILQVVISQRFQQEIKSSPFEIYRALRSINPSPYMFFLKFQDLYMVGSSPETMVKVSNGTVTTKPIAGTRRRGRTEDEDVMFEKELISDEKERAEHLMLVDLGRNDIGKISVPGSVNVTQFMDIERYSHVMHIVSEVEGRLDPRYDVYDAIKSTFPAGTVSGAPKIRAMEIIDELEPTKRGPYAGLVGYICFDGHLDTCITIRTIVCKDNIAYVQAGAGIVADSEPELEYKETVNKARALLKAVAT